MSGPPDPRPDPGTRAVSLTVPYRVRFDESTPAGTLRASALLRYAQDCAWAHSEQLGFGREWYASRGLWWLVRAVELRLVGTLPTGAIAAVTTTVIGFRRVLARRRTTIVGPDGSAIASIDTDWAMVDDAGVPARIPAAFPELMGAEVPSFTPHRVALPVAESVSGPAPDPVSLAFEVRPQELDPMGHANNAVYLDWLDEAVARAAPDVLVRLPRTWRLEYLLPATPGRPLVGTAWRTGQGSAAYRLSDGASVLLRGTVAAWGRRAARRVPRVPVRRGTEPGAPAHRRVVRSSHGRRPRTALRRTRPPAPGARSRRWSCPPSGTWPDDGRPPGAGTAGRPGHGVRLRYGRGRPGRRRCRRSTGRAVGRPWLILP